MIVGVALVVDELHKGQRLVCRYPLSVKLKIFIIFSIQFITNLPILIILISLILLGSFSSIEFACIINTIS